MSLSAYREECEAHPNRCPPKPEFDRGAAMREAASNASVGVLIALGLRDALPMESVSTIDRSIADGIIEQVDNKEERHRRKWACAWYDECQNRWRFTKAIAGKLTY